MMPEMEGGVFWEHLHRLVAGGLVLMFVLATWLVRREAPERRWLFRLSLGGVGLLLVQAVFGGITVLMRLPPAVSTTHLLLALLFLCIAVVLAAATEPTRERALTIDPRTRTVLRRWVPAAAGLVVVQSLVGGAVRHLGAGLACPDVPLCLGQVVPPLTNSLTALHFTHRAIGLLTGLVVLAAMASVMRSGAPARVRVWATASATLVVAQIGIGLLSVTMRLAVLPVSAHTLVAAALLGALVLLTTWGWMSGAVEGEPRKAAGGMRAAARAA
jgi:heme A synthase